MVEIRDTLAQQADEARISALEDVAFTGAPPFASWDDLSAAPGDVDGERASVPFDEGTHDDPVSGELGVPNQGYYTWDAAAAGWLRTSDTLAEYVRVRAAEAIQTLDDVNAAGATQIAAIQAEGDTQAARSQEHAEAAQESEGKAAQSVLMAAAQVGYDPVSRSLAAADQDRLNNIEGRVAVLESGGLGQITAARIHVEGWFMEIDMAAAHAGGVWDYSKMTLTSYDWGFAVVDGAIRKVVVPRVMKPTIIRRKADPDFNLDEANIVGGTVTFLIALPSFIYDKAKKGGDGTTGRNPILAVQTGFYAEGGVPAKGQLVEVTNNSTETYQKGCGQAQLPPHRLLDATPTFEFMGSGPGAQQGRGFAAAKCTLTGGTSGAKLEKIVSAVTRSVYEATRFYPSIGYITTLTAGESALFTQGETITERWQAYPWLGDESAILDSADGGGVATVDLSNQQHVCNRLGTYPIVYAVVDPVAGNNGTGVAHSVEATALASPFLDDRFALYKAHVYGQANYGANGYRVVVEFGDGADNALLTQTSNVFAPTADPSLEDLPSAGLLPTWTVYKPKAGAAPRIVSTTATGRGFVPPRTRVENMTLHASISSRPCVTRGIADTTTVSEVWAKDVVFTDANLANNLQFYQIGQFWLTGFSSETTSVSQNIINAFGSTATQFKLIRDGDIAGGSSAAIIPQALNGVRVRNMANRSLTGAPAANVNQQFNDGAVFCNFGGFKGTASMLSIARQRDKGLAIVNMLLEAIGSDIQPAVAGGTAEVTLKNLFVDHFGFIGARGNFGYEDTFTLAGVGQQKKLFHFRCSYFYNWHHKDDTFQHVTARTHTANIGHHVGMRDNDFLGPDSDASTAPGRDRWYGEVWGPRENYVGAWTTQSNFSPLVFTDYQAGQTNTGAGGGNYQPLVNTTLGRVANDNLACALDLLGNVRLTDGTSARGPIERAAA